jgi:hypothetical protein
MLHQVGDLFELNVKLRCQNAKDNEIYIPGYHNVIYLLSACKISNRDVF